MKLQELTIGMKVRHPQYGEGVVEKLSNVDASVRFDNILRAVDPELADIAPLAAAAPANAPVVEDIVATTIQATLRRLGVENASADAEELGTRWQNGKLTLHPADPTLQTKEVPLEVFFHKIVMVRNNLRVLEQKINAHEKLSDADKVEMQQYITRCYGSMTTFNVLFKNREDQFSSKAE